MRIYTLGLIVGLSVCLTCLQGQNAILEQSKLAIGLNHLQKPVLHYYYNQVNLGREQSDRPYPPFLTFVTNGEAWFDIENNSTGVKSYFLSPGNGPAEIPRIFFTGIGKSYLINDTSYIPIKLEYDKLNVWAVLLDWCTDHEVNQVNNEVYRDYDRMVFERPGLHGKERLFIDPKTFFPVKLDYEELHSLWGQQFIEIVYSNWTLVEGSSFPLTSFRLEDGVPMTYRAIGTYNLSDSVSVFTRFRQLPANGQKKYDREWYVSEEPKLIRISDQTFLSKNNFYTETFTKFGDTVYLLDATLSQDRAVQDEKLIRQAFPIVTHFVIVVTDLAWPHVGGVRYWVSKGAIIVSHRASKIFLEKIVDRKWTVHPDELQMHPQKMNFRAIANSTDLANGALRIFPLDGIGSEGSLGCYLVKDQLLWASDYIQDIHSPTEYAKEVIKAVNREGIQPEKVVAEHIELTDWIVITKTNL